MVKMSKDTQIQVFENQHMQVFQQLAQVTNKKAYLTFKVK